MSIAHDETERNARAPTLIAQWEINRRETVRVEIHQYRGHTLLGIRKWFFVDDGEMRPGKDGINLNIKHLPRLATAIADALSKARVDGIIPEADGA